MVAPTLLGIAIICLLLWGIKILNQDIKTMYTEDEVIDLLSLYMDDEFSTPKEFLEQVKKKRK